MDHLDHRIAVHQRRPGVPRDPKTGFPLLHASPPGTRSFLDPRFIVHDVAFIPDFDFVGYGRPHPHLEVLGFDVWEACAITGWFLYQLYYVQDSVRVDDGGTHEIFEECRRPGGRYSPIRLWEFRIDILDSRAAECARREKRKALAAYLAERAREGLPIDPTTFGRCHDRGAAEEDSYYPLGD